MDGDRAERLGAASGFLVLAFGAAAMVFERSPVTAEDFLTHRAALLTQSMLFLAGGAVTLWFLGSLRAHLRRAEGGSGRLSAVVFGSGVAWVTVNLLAQAFQVGVADARSAAPDALLRTMTAVFTTANLPLAVMLLGVATITLRHRAFPGWLGWIAVVAAAAQAVLWITTVVDSGPLAPDGWLSFVLYPFFLIWLVPATALMVRGTVRPHTRAAPATSSRTVQKVLLASGIGYGVAYLIANDLIAATIFDGYRRIDQAISELSGTGAPSRGFLNAMLPLFTVLVLAFGVGVWRAAGRSRALRVTGAILIAQAIMFPLWLLFPMTSRDEMAQATSHTNDLGHLILSLLAVLFIVAEMAFSAAALGGWFRSFAFSMMITAVAAGGYVATTASDVAAGDPTPWMGAVERLSYGSWLLWMAVLAIVLLRRPVPPAASGRDSGIPGGQPLRSLTGQASASHDRRHPVAAQCRPELTEKS